MNLETFCKMYKNHILCIDNEHDENYIKCNFSGIDFTGMCLDGMNIVGVDFSYSNFTNASMRFCNFYNCNFNGAVFNDTYVSNTDFYKSIFSGANINTSTMNDCIFDSCTFNEISVKNTIFSRSIFVNSTFSDSTFICVNFIEVEMDNISFIAPYTKFKFCNFDECDIILISGLSDIFVFQCIFDGSKPTNSISYLTNNKPILFFCFIKNLFYRGKRLNRGNS